MQFSAKTEAQIQEESLIPVGEYDFTVVKADNKVSKNTSSEMIQLDMDVFVDGVARPLKDWLMEQMAYKLRHFCFSVGLGSKYEDGNLQANDCVGRSGKVKIGIKESAEYGKQNNVKDYVVLPPKFEAVKNGPQLPKPLPANIDPNEPPF